jgi:hypothetical protein
VARHLRAFERPQLGRRVITTPAGGDSWDFPGATVM